MNPKIDGLTYAETKAVIAELEAAMKPFGDYLRSCPRHPNGLTLDHVKATPQWRHARTEYDRLAGILRKFNAYRVRTFKNEMAAERREKFPARFPTIEPHA